MKRILLALWFNLWATLAFAGVPCTLPFTLTNGTTADASQVMANYNALVSCLNSAAAAGANADITSLTAITTPLSPSEGGTFLFFGGTSTGSANAQVVAITTPTNFSLTTKYGIIFKAGFTNTGATTLAVNGTTATNVFKQAPGGALTALTGNEILINDIVFAFYNGTQYELMQPSSIFPLLTSLASLTTADQVLSGGANVTSLNLGSLSGGGTTTIDCGSRPLQFFTNAGAQTLAAPANDGSCEILMVNNASAGAITFSGFTVGANTGEALTTTNTNQFIITITRINAVATYFIKALQ